MATKKKPPKHEDDDALAESESRASDSDLATAEPASLEGEAEGVAEEPRTPAQLGATKYVHAAFFGAGILVAYLSGKIVTSLWNSLSEWPTAVRAVPQLLRYAEEDRESIAMIAGALVGVLVVVQTYRKEHVRRWADDVASELAKVTWPNKEMVTNGTIVVIVASAVFTVYIALLDRFWGFLTTLVYGV
jgi:preprotein translocase subunit SecE